MVNILFILLLPWKVKKPPPSINPPSDGSHAHHAVLLSRDAQNQDSDESEEYFNYLNTDSSRPLPAGLQAVTQCTWEISHSHFRILGYVVPALNSLLMWNTFYQVCTSVWIACILRFSFLSFYNTRLHNMLHTKSIFFRGWVEKRSCLVVCSGYCLSVCGCMVVVF